MFDTLIVVAAGDGPSGQEIRRRLAGEPYNHGRLSRTGVYEILYEAVDDGYIEKSKRDGRTNAYTLSDDSREYLREWRDILDEALGD